MFHNKEMISCSLVYSCHCSKFLEVSYVMFGTVTFALMTCNLLYHKLNVYLVHLYKINAENCSIVLTDY